MSTTKRKFIGWKLLETALPLAGAIVLHGCGGNLAAPSSATVASTNMSAGPQHNAPGSMSVQKYDDRSFSDAKYVKIFDNLAERPSGKYWGGSEVVIAGGDGTSTFKDTQIAGAFTPSANHTATVVEVAAVCPAINGYGCGSGFTLNLNEDNNGIPGKALITAQIPGFPPNVPLCCSLIIGNIPSGLALTGGKQYWIVIDGQGAQSSDLAAWDENAVDQVHPFLDAVYCASTSQCPKGVGWYPFQESVGFGTGLAFAVLGSK